MFFKNLKSQNYCYLNKNWRIKNQILIIQVVSSLFVFILLAASIIIGLQIVQKKIEESSEKIFFKQTSSQLNSVWLHKKNLQQLLKAASQQIQIVKLLNIFSQKTGINTTQPQQCLNKPYTNDSYCYNHTYCFGLFGDEYDQTHIDQLSYVFSVISLLTSLRIAMDNTQVLYFSHINKAQFYTISSGFYFNSGYKPHSRPWYVYHMNQTSNLTNNNDLIVYGKPYKIYYSEGIRIALTSSLHNDKNQVEGVIAKDINFNQILNYRLQDTETTLIVINNKGQVIFSRLYDEENKNIHSIFDEVYTGFNETDFQQIMNYHNQKNYSNSCNMAVDSEVVLCRYNSKLVDYCIIQTASIQNTPYILVLFKRTKNIKMQQQQQFNFIKNEEQDLTNKSIIMYLCSTLTVILIAYLIFIVMLKQLNLLISYTKYSIYDNWIINLPLQAFTKQKYLIQSQEITKLYYSVVKLIHNLKPSKKNKQCLLEEDKQLPRQRKIKKLLQIKELIQQIDEDNQLADYSFDQ